MSATALRDLEAAGIEHRQAEAIAGTVRAAAAANRDALATKADLAELRASTAADIAELRADLAETKAGIYRALWIQGVAIVAILTALRFLPV